MSDDLVERLRVEARQATGIGHVYVGRMYGAAADRIEALTAMSIDLAQALWDINAILGFDQDGGSGPQALIAGMGWAGFIDCMKRDAAEFRKDYDDLLGELPLCVESSSSGEGGDQWPEATGASAAEREEVAAHEVDPPFVAEAPEGTQPPGLSDGDER